MCSVEAIKRPTHLVPSFAGRPPRKDRRGACGARAGPRRPGAAGRLAAAASAALARRSARATPARSRAGDGIVLVDTGIHEPGALAQLERTLDQAGQRLEDVRLLVCTHAHSDHYGLAAPIVERAGCELWMHPNHEHMTRAAADPERALERRIEVARQSGVPLEPLRELGARSAASQKPGIAEVVAAGPRAAARRRGRDRPRHLERARDARPRSVPRRPVPARAAACC